MGKKGGKQPGAGRPVGSINRMTRTRIEQTAVAVAGMTRAQQRLAVEIMNDCMQAAMGYAASYQQAMQDAKTADNPTNFRAAEKRFEKWLEKTGFFAKMLAPFQSPRLKSIQIMTAPSLLDDGAPTSKIKEVKDSKVISIDDEAALLRLYQNTIRRVA